AALTLIRREWRPEKTVLAAACVAIGLATIGSSNAGDRWLQPVRDIVAHRVIPHRSLRSYFTARGLDLSVDWTQGSWIHHRARGVYGGYIVRHPGYLFASPLSGRQEALYSTPGNAASMLDPSMKIYNDNASHRFLPLPHALEGAAFPRGIVLICVLLAI